MEVVEEEQFTFSYGQCLYCFIGLVQIKTSVLRKEETGSVQNKDKTFLYGGLGGKLASRNNRLIQNESETTTDHMTDFPE